MDPKDTQKDNTELAAVTDRYGYLAVKNQKLASALYLVTNFLNDSEPVKWKLRDRALALAGEFSVGRHSTVFYKLSLLERAIRLCDEIVSLLDIARAIGAASEMNLSVLKDEYLQIKGQLEQLAGGGQLEQYLMVDEPARRELPLARPEPEAFKPAPAGLPYRPTPQSPTSRPSALVRPVARESAEPKNGRKQVIITFLENKDWTSIKDIAGVVPDCSQKTVQRELSDLVEQGVLKKRGDRRWSRYVLAK